MRFEVLKVNNLCKIAPSRTSEAGLTTCVCYFIAAIIIVITTYGTFNICGITSHKTSAITKIKRIRRKLQSNGRHILHDKKTWWQKTNLFLEIACTVCTCGWMGEWWENTILWVEVETCNSAYSMIDRLSPVYKQLSVLKTGELISW